MPAATLRTVAAATLPDRQVTSEALGRIAHYAEESFLRQREAPRFAWVINPDGTAPSPRIWAHGSWRLSRRILTEDAIEHWTEVLAMFLCTTMINASAQAREILAPTALEAVSRVLGPRALHLPGTREDWSALAAELAPHQHPTGPAQTLSSQDQAAKRLEVQEFAPFSLYFGVGETVLTKTDELPPSLRLAHSAESGIAFDELVLERAGGDRALAREVVAYLQEWGLLADEHGGEADLRAYAQRWQVDLATARERNEQFRGVFPSEETPRRIWRLLWGAAAAPPGSVPRLISLPVVESGLPPTVINHFTNCLADELRETPALGARVVKAIATFEESGDPPAGRELRRFYSLCERVRLWAAQALAGAGEPDQAIGLLSIEAIVDEQSAAFAEEEIGAHRRGLPAGPHRNLLRDAQRTLRVAAALYALEPPATTTPYLPGVQLAAKTLSQTRSEDLTIDTVKEAVAAVRALGLVH